MAEFLRIPSKRFRLFVAADTQQLGIDVISAFASGALVNGMVYFCAWGPGCERFHDVVDQVELEVSTIATDIVMTTWHEEDTLEEALDFFATCAVPCDGLLLDSGFRLVICLNSAEWADGRAVLTIRSVLLVIEPGELRWPWAGGVARPHQDRVYSAEGE